MTFEEMKIYDKIYAMCINNALENGHIPKGLKITFDDYFGFTKVMREAIRDLGLEIVLAFEPYVLKVIDK